jgi:hypothetical protein
MNLDKREDIEKYKGYYKSELKLGKIIDYDAMNIELSN